MTIEDKIFKCSTVNLKALIPYGFKQNKNGYVIEKTFMNDSFKAIVTIDQTGLVNGVVYDVDSDDVYMPLRVEEMAVGFAGLVRSAYEAVLEDIKTHCFVACQFVGAQANRIAELIKQHYGDEPDFPWEKSEDYGVFRNPINEKWYALIMNIDKSKIDKKLSGAVDVVNIKLDENEIRLLLKEKGFYPAYHMNKKSWITLILDETLNDDTVMELIDKSHAFTIGKRAKYKGNKQAWLIPANPKFFDIVGAFKKENEIIWKQSAKLKVGDIVYMYVGVPYSAVLYQCEVTEADIPYSYQDKNLTISKVMRIKKLKEYDKNLMTFQKLAEFDVRAVRGPRDCPQELVQWLERQKG